MARSLGVSFQPDGFQYALLEGSTRKYVVKAIGVGQLDPDSDDPEKFLGKALARAMKRAGKADDVTVTTPSVGTVLRELSLPFSDREKIAQVLKFEVESDLYHLDIDDVVCDFIELEDERATSSILVTAEPKAHIASALAICEEAGTEPFVVDLDLGALLCTLTEIQARKETVEGELEAFLHLGPFSSLLVVMAGTNVRAVRDIRVGWREMARGVEDQYVGEAPEPLEEEQEEEREAIEEMVVEGEAGAETEPVEEEVPSGGPVRLFGADPELPVGLDLQSVLMRAKPEARGAMVRRLASEVRRGLAAVASAPVLRLHLLGAPIAGLDEALQGRLGVPAHTLELGVAGPEGVEPDPVALGAALRGLGSSASPMNFRQEEFRVTRGLERIEGPLTWMLVGLIAYFLVDGVVLFQRAKPMREAADSIFVKNQEYVDLLNEKLQEEDPEDWRVRTDPSGRDLDELARIRWLLGGVREQERKLDEEMGEAGIEMPQSSFDGMRLTMLVLEEELGDYNTPPYRWMLETIDLTSIDEKTNMPAHVDVKLTLTLFGTEATSIDRKFEDVMNAFRGKPWVLGEVAAPGGVEQADTPGARTAKIEIKLSPDAAKEGKA